MSDAAVTVTPTSAIPQAGDVLVIVGQVVVVFDGVTYGAQVSAQGWTSATTTHYPPEAYGPDGHRLGHWQDAKGNPVATDAQDRPADATWVDDVLPRPMTQDELRAYCVQQLVEAFIAATPLALQDAKNLLTS